MDNIEKYFNNEENSYYGHGIGGGDEKTIQSILKNGLRCSHEQLAYTTVEFRIGSQWAI